MKKKGLIISTVVMVVVLIASLTTATYAWFSVSNNTSISGFDVSVTSNNAINIGLKGDNYTNGTSPDEFVSGSCAYVPGTAEKFFGHWTGNTSLAPTIDDTGVYWGAQSKAVGFASTKISASAATYENVGFFPETSGDFAGTAIAANGSANTLSAPELAIVNGAKGEETTYGNYAYLFIGAKPIKAIQDGTNKFYVVVQPQGAGTSIGMAAAVHVAYRTKLTGAESWTAWNDIDVWSQSETESENKHYGDQRSSSTITIVGDYSGSAYKLQNATKVAATETEPVKTTIVGAQVVTIDLSAYTSTATEAGIDQIEMVIYLAGKDGDCVDSAKNGSTFIGLFFGSQEAKAAKA